MVASADLSSGPDASSGQCLRPEAGSDTDPYESTLIQDAPVAQYRLGDAPGSLTVMDSSGHGLTGTVHGGVTLGASGALDSEPSTTAASFDGSSGWIDLGNPGALHLADGSVEAWIKTTNTDATFHAIAISWLAYGLFLHNGRLVTFDWGSGTERDSGAVVADGNWHHVVLTFQIGATGQSVLYVDGASKLNTTINVSGPPGNAMISNGSSTSPQQFFPGTIDEVAFYNVPLSPARVAAHYMAGLYSGLIAFAGPSAWYRFEDAVGSSAATDSSGNGLTGTVHGTVTFGQAGALTHETTTKSALFDGSSGWIDLANPFALQVSNGSVEAWVKTTNTDATFHAIAIKWLAYGLFLHNGRLVTFDWSSSTERDSMASVADGGWHHVAVTFQSGVPLGTTLYVDGASKLNTTITVADQRHNAMISNGSSENPQQFFPGDLDEVAFYPCTLSPSQVQRHAAAGVH